MERYLEFRIDEQTTELKMEAFLKKNAGLTKRQISQAKFRPDGITRNGVRCRVTEQGDFNYFRPHHFAPGDSVYDRQRDTGGG